jgi:signal transduction histidine kinase/CheY-like chemotaxis protein
MKFNSKKSIHKEKSIHNVEHICMSFSVHKDNIISLSNELTSFLNIKQSSDFNQFKSKFLASEHHVIDDIFNSKKNRSTLLELIDHKICRFSFDHLKQNGYMLYLPEISNLKNELNASKEKLKMQESFLYQMSHELKTPLSAISSYLDLLKQKDLDSDSMLYINQIEKAYDQGLYQMNSILDLSKLNYQQAPLKEDQIILNSFFEDIYHIFKASIEKKDLLFHITHHDDFSFISDQAMIKQVLTNLISNAIKFTEHGSISIETNLIKNTNEYTLNINLSDTGIGMTNEEQETIFSTFSQANEGISKLYGGSGLGLSISQKLISLLKGSIKVESQYRVGTTFIISIPIKLLKNKTSQDIKKQAYEKPKPGLTILIAEDNILSAHATLNLLKQIDLNAQIAKNGKEAIQMFLEYPFDLILMDVSMPIVDGFEASLSIREKDSLIPIIAMTANTYQDHHKKCIDAKMNDVLYKPFKSQDLYQIINKFTK